MLTFNLPYSPKCSFVAISLAFAASISVKNVPNLIFLLLIVNSETHLFLSFLKYTPIYFDDLFSDFVLFILF